MQNVWSADARIAELEAQVAKLSTLEAQVAKLSALVDALNEEIARLRGQKQKPRSNDKPSALSKSPTEMPSDGKRPGSAKRSKTAELVIHEETPVPPKDLPPGSQFVRSDAFVVQDLIIQAHNTRYLLEVWQTPTGEELRGELPAGIHGHYGPGVLAFVLQQHYAAHVTQPRILEELLDFGIDISSGQVNHLVTEDHQAFHAEKEALLPTGLQVSTQVTVDDSGARIRGSMVPACVSVMSSLPVSTAVPARNAASFWTCSAAVIAITCSTKRLGNIWKNKGCPLRCCGSCGSNRRGSLSIRAPGSGISMNWTWPSRTGRP